MTANLRLYYTLVLPFNYNLIYNPTLRGGFLTFQPCGAVPLHPNQGFLNTGLSPRILLKNEGAAV